MSVSTLHLLFLRGEAAGQICTDDPRITNALLYP